MLKRKLKWRILFEHRIELEKLLTFQETAVYRNAFGEILLVRDGDTFYAFKNKCPHQNKPLNGCTLFEGHVVCPWHKYSFSCETGRGHGFYLEQYPLRFENDVVYIGKEGWVLFSGNQGG